MLETIFLTFTSYRQSPRKTGIKRTSTQINTSENNKTIYTAAAATFSFSIYTHTHLRLSHPYIELCFCPFYCFPTNGLSLFSDGI